MSDWYVLQIKPGMEHDAVKALREKGYEAFTPSRIMLEQRGKSTKEVERLMLTGYVFVSLTMSVRAHVAIRSADGVIRFLGASMPETVPEGEMKRMLILGNGGEPWGVSEGYKEDGVIVVTSGPLKGREDWIVSSDPRRSRAKVQITVLGESKSVELALRMTSRQEQTPGDTSPVVEAAEQTEITAAAMSEG